MLEALQNQEKKPLILSVSIGGVIGMLISFIVNSTLAEISISPFFSIVIFNQYFGALFVLVGAAIIWRLQAQEDLEPVRRLCMYTFGVLVIISGALSIYLDKTWFTGVDPYTKIPMYGLLGVSVAFALTFAIVDLINYVSQYFQSTYSKPPIESFHQVALVLGGSSIMGLTFGCIFGMMDIEDINQVQFRQALIQEESYCYPIGLIIGGVCGAINQILKSQNDYEPPSDDFDEEI